MEHNDNALDPRKASGLAKKVMEDLGEEDCSVADAMFALASSLIVVSRIAKYGEAAATVDLVTRNQIENVIARAQNP